MNQIKMKPGHKNPKEQQNTPPSTPSGCGHTDEDHRKMGADWAHFIQKTTKEFDLSQILCIALHRDEANGQGYAVGAGEVLNSEGRDRIAIGLFALAQQNPYIKSLVLEVASKLLQPEERGDGDTETV